MRPNRLIQAIRDNRMDSPFVHDVIPPLMAPVPDPPTMFLSDPPTPPCIEIELASEVTSNSSTTSHLLSLDLGHTLMVPAPHDARSQSFILGRSFTNIRQTKEVKWGMCSVSGYEIINQYVVLDECIGKGAQGEIALVVDSGTNVEYALKTINRSRLLSRALPTPDCTPRSSTSSSTQPGSRLNASSRHQELGYETNREVAIMKRARHPNIVRLHEVIDDPHHGKLYLVMELLHKPVCPDFSMKNGTCTPVDPELLKRYLYEVLSGLHFLHRHSIVHRDLKPDNMMLNKKGEVVLIDFGVSEVADDTTIVSGFAGTPAFIAPEVWSASHVLGPATDVWSLGVCFYILLVGRTPFSGDSRSAMLEAISNSPIEFPDHAPPEWRECLSAMLVKDPVHRISVEACRKLTMLNPFAQAKKAEVAERRASEGFQPESPLKLVFDDVTEEDVEVAVSVRCASLSEESETARRFVMRTVSSISTLGRPQCGP